VQASLSTIEGRAGQDVFYRRTTRNRWRHSNGGRGEKQSERRVAPANYFQAVVMHSRRNLLTNVSVLDAGMPFEQEPFTPAIRLHKIREVLDEQGTRMR
jgi:hypothetical protein